MVLLGIVAVVLAYLIGSINFAVIFSSIFLKKDVRSLGSGNAGTTNVMRNGGFLPGALTFLFDALKGYAASFIGLKIFEYIFTQTESNWSVPIYGAFVCGTACMVGHIFPIFFQFKGGKGVATSVGIFAVCCPVAIISGLIVFALVLAISKMVSLSSLIATVTVVTLTGVFHSEEGLLFPQLIFALIMGAIVFIKHSSNIKRIANGTESKIGKGGKKNA